MKHAKHIPFLFAVLLLTYTALAQIGTGPASRTLAEGEEVSAARSQYAQTADSSPDTTTLKRWLNLPNADRGCRIRPSAATLVGNATQHRGWIMGALVTP